MKNNRLNEQITANISLYFSNGAEVSLPAATLGPRQTLTFDLNEIVRNLPPSAGAGNSREGTIEVEYVGPNASSIMGSVSVINPQKKIAWNFFLYAERPGLAVAPLRGVFWFPNAQTEGFIALQNMSEEPLLVTPTFQTRGRWHSAQSITLAPEQGAKLDIRQALAQAGLSRTTEAGVELTYEGEPDALRAHGLLYDGEGFSSEVDFLRFDSFDEDLDFNYRTPRLAVGAADPVLGLPDRTTFRPNLVLHNFNAYRMDIQLALGVRTGSGSREFMKTISLDPGETRVLEPHRAVLAQLPDDLHWVSLELSYHGRHNGLGMMLVSTSAGERHSLRSVLNWVHSASREGWIWKADQEHNTLLGVFNSEAEEARVAISLDFYDGGVRYSYDLPERTIPKRSADLLNIKQIIDAHVPDKDGEVIPASVTFGGYRVRKVAPTSYGNLTTEALLFAGAGSPFLAIYNTGCCQETPFIEPYGITGDAGGSSQFQFWANNTCTGYPDEEPITIDGFIQFSSTDPSVAYGDYGDPTHGYMGLVSPGKANVMGFPKHPKPWNYVCRDQPEWSTPCAVTVKPKITSISPPRGLIGDTTSVTINGLGLGISPTVQAGTGISVTVNTATDTQIQADFAVSTSAPSGNHALTVTIAGQTSNSVNFFVQIPASLQVLTQTVLPTGIKPDDDATAGCRTNYDGDFGIKIAVRYQVLDQTGTTPILSSSLRPQETITDQCINGVCDDPVPYYSDIGPSRITGTSQFTDSNGQFLDAPLGACGGSSFTASATQRIAMLVGQQLFVIRTNLLSISGPSLGHGSISSAPDIQKSR